jgi:polysaccharide deacetylase 2 family uncharacterized protein YibQ
MDEPLGFVGAASATLPARRKRPTRGAAVGGAILAIAVVLFMLPRREFPVNGEPFAIAKVESLPAPRKIDAPDVTASVRQTASPPATSEAPSSVKVTGGIGSGSKALIIDVAQALGVKLAPSPDPRLIERSNYGLLPRIGPDGTRPIDLYARAVDRSSKAGSPRIALVVGGFGLNGAGAESAIAKLPGAVTLGFTPTGASVEQQAAQAREAGHETVLQARLEASSEENGGLGSHMQRTTASGVDNLDSLHWQMGRFTGYVAVVNDLDHKSVADRGTTEEIARRGLGFLDGAASSGAVTNDLTASAPMPSAHADIVIDANATPAAVDAALSRLVELARQRGSAIGVASDSPSSVERLARWGNELEAKGIALVPLSALMSGMQGRSSQLNRFLSP